MTYDEWKTTLPDDTTWEEYVEEFGFEDEDAIESEQQMTLEERVDILERELEEMRELVTSLVTNISEGPTLEDAVEVAKGFEIGTK